MSGRLPLLQQRNDVNAGSCQHVSLPAGFNRPQWWCLRHYYHIAVMPSSGHDQCVPQPV